MTPQIGSMFVEIFGQLKPSYMLVQPQKPNEPLNWAVVRGESLLASVIPWGALGYSKVHCHVSWPCDHVGGLLSGTSCEWLNWALSHHCWKFRLLTDTETDLHPTPVVCDGRRALSVCGPAEKGFSLHPEIWQPQTTGLKTSKGSPLGLFGNGLMPKTLPSWQWKVSDGPGLSHACPMRGSSEMAMQ